jgi:hypothetical protein
MLWPGVERFHKALEDILFDSITKAVMEADGVDPQQLAAMLKEVERRWAAHARFGMLAEAAWHTGHC